MSLVAALDEVAVIKGNGRGAAPSTTSAATTRGGRGRARGRGRGGSAAKKAGGSGKKAATTTAAAASSSFAPTSVPRGGEFPRQWGDVADPLGDTTLRSSVREQFPAQRPEPLIPLDRAALAASMTTPTPAAPAARVDTGDDGDAAAAGRVLLRIKRKRDEAPVNTIYVAGAEKKHALNDIRLGLSSLSVDNSSSDSKDAVSTSSSSEEAKSASSSSSPFWSAPSATVLAAPAAALARASPSLTTLSAPTSSGVAAAPTAVASSTPAAPAVKFAKPAIQSGRRVFRLLQSVSSHVPGSHANLLHSLEQKSGLKALPSMADDRRGRTHDQSASARADYLSRKRGGTAAPNARNLNIVDVEHVATRTSVGSSSGRGRGRGSGRGVADVSSDDLNKLFDASSPSMGRGRGRGTGTGTIAADRGPAFGQPPTRSSLLPDIGRALGTAKMKARDQRVEQRRQERLQREEALYQRNKPVADAAAQRELAAAQRELEQKQATERLNNYETLLTQTLPAATAAATAAAAAAAAGAPLASPIRRKPSGKKAPSETTAAPVVSLPAAAPSAVADSKRGSNGVDLDINNNNGGDDNNDAQIEIVGADSTEEDGYVYDYYYEDIDDGEDDPDAAVVRFKTTHGEQLFAGPAERAEEDRRDSDDSNAEDNDDKDYRDDRDDDDDEDDQPDTIMVKRNIGAHAHDLSDDDDENLLRKSAAPDRFTAKRHKELRTALTAAAGYDIGQHMKTDDNDIKADNAADGGSDDDDDDEYEDDEVYAARDDRRRFRERLERYNDPDGPDYDSDDERERHRLSQFGSGHDPEDDGDDDIDGDLDDMDASLATDARPQVTLPLAGQRTWFRG